MKFSLDKSIDILDRTPSTLKSLLFGLSDEWLRSNEGADTWSPYEVLGHLIIGEKTDWITHLKIILSDAENKEFEPFDRFAQQREDQSKPVEDMLADFASLRINNLQTLKSSQIDDEVLSKTGIHPAFGRVTLKELIATWVAHDLGHIAQISRVMARQYQEEVGPWKAYLGILKST